MVGNFDRLLNPVPKVLDSLQPLLRKTIKSLRFVIIFYRTVHQKCFVLINVTLYAPLRYPVNYLHYKVGNGVDKNSRETSRSPRVAANESRDSEGERGSQRPSEPASLFWTDHGDSNLNSAFLFTVAAPTAQTELAEKSASKFAVGRPDWWVDIFNCTFIPLFFFLRADHLSAL